MAADDWDFPMSKGGVTAKGGGPFSANKTPPPKWSRGFAPHVLLWQKKRRVENMRFCTEDDKAYCMGT